VLRFFWGGWSSFELMDGTKLWPLVRAKTQRSQERNEDGEGDGKVDGRWDCGRFF
jgi:hypothetical protein